jgi:transposase
MGGVHRCPRCGEGKPWRVRRGHLKCRACRREWQPAKLPLTLTRTQWRRVAHLFVLGLSTKQVTEESGLQRTRVLRALSAIRRSLFLDSPEAFTGVVEVDETYVGGKRRNQRRAARAVKVKHGRGTMKATVFGIRCRSGQVWAEVVPNLDAATLMASIHAHVTEGSVVCSDELSTYTGVAAQGYVHRLVRHGHGQYSDGRGTHINGLEGFWGYLKRHLVSRGGIRRERLPLFLNEYVWRYNHRKETIATQETNVLHLLEKQAQARL